MDKNNKLLFIMSSIESNLFKGYSDMKDKSRKISKWKNGERFAFNYEMILPSLPDTIFPLLCPILEYDWLNNWKCTMIFSESGIAENNCIFYTSSGFPFYKRMTFQIIDYKPNEKIEFLIYIHKVGTVRFSLSLQKIDENITKMICNYILTGHSGFGNKQLKKYKEKKVLTEVKNLESDLVYWLNNKTKRPLIKH